MVFPNHNKRLNPMLNGGKFADREVGTQASRLTSPKYPRDDNVSGKFINFHQSSFQCDI